MDHIAFDALIRRWHAGVTRRQGIATLLGGLAAITRAGASPPPAAGSGCLADGDRCGGHQHPSCDRCCSDTSKRRTNGGRKCVCRHQGDTCTEHRQCCSRACDTTGVCVEQCTEDAFCGQADEPPCCLGYACNFRCQPLLGNACDPIFTPCFPPNVCNGENVCATFCGGPGVVCLNGAADCCAGLACVNTHCCRPAGTFCDGNVACCPGLSCIADVCTA